MCSNIFETTIHRMKYIENNTRNGNNFKSSIITNLETLGCLSIYIDLLRTIIIYMPVCEQSGLLDNVWILLDLFGLLCGKMYTLCGIIQNCTPSRQSSSGGVNYTMFF